MIRVRRNYVVGAIGSVVLMIAVLATLAATATSAHVAGPIYKVGFAASLSGPGSVFADNGLQSAELAISQIQKQHIIPGTIQLIKVDDAGDPATSQQVCSRLVLQDKVDAIIGFQNSANRQACLPVATRANVPYIYTTPYEGGVCEKNFFVDGEVPKQQVDPIVSYMTRVAGSKKWYLTGSNYIAMTAGNAYAATQIKRLGGSVVGQTYASLNSTDFSAIINNILSSGADTAFVNFLGTDFIAFLKQWTTTPGTDKVKAVTFGIPIGAGSAVKDLYTAFSYFPSIKSARNVAYKAALKQMFGSKAQLPSILSVVVYDGMWMWAKAVQKAGSPDYAKVNAALHQITFNGPRGPIHFNSQGHATLPMYMATLNGDPLKGGEHLLKSYPPLPPGNQCH